LSSKSGRTQWKLTPIDLDTFQDDKKCACSNQPEAVLGTIEKSFETAISGDLTVEGLAD
jgi:hypothetical protein